MRKLRKQKGLSLHNLGKELGVTGGAISAWELGHKEPNVDMIIKIADFFAVSVDFLIRHEFFENEEHKDDVINQLAKELADEIYTKSGNIPVFKAEMIDFISYLEHKQRISEKNNADGNKDKD
ncbi:helix-turn-helix domain-containing protein [Bacillus thuringiensis]|uniref:helix-turn-helix domain-containing protein n=2 Tax=Bacillus TaxID=1386 RepID=UPI0004102B85|nr:helix-turn-helix transcriptional regulator [Bacillus thuringiensis]